MAYVPEYEHDIFISYRHLDNKPTLYPGGRQFAWVTEFRQILQDKINQKLGNEETMIWMDITDMPGHEPLVQTLDNRVKTAATLIVILSPGYLQSQYCLAELKAFTEEESREGRIFVVNFSNLNFEEKPSQLMDLIGYDFFDKDSGETIASEADIYGTSLRRLRNELATILQNLRNSSPSRASVPVHPQPTAAASATDEPPATVLLAEGTPDQQTDLEGLKEFLKQSNCKVLPQNRYRRGAEEYRKQLMEDLKDCKLFIQYLGPYATARTDDFPEGYEGLQLACAKEANVPLLRGCRLKTFRDRDKVDDASHANFLNSADIIAEDLEDFKRTILNKLKAMHQKKTDQNNGSKSVPKPIYIYVKQDDEASANKIKSILDNQNLYWEIYYFDDQTSLEDVAKTLIPAGLILIYGEKTDKVRLREEVKRVRNINNNARGEPVCALYFDPPSKREQMLVAVPPFLIPLNSEDIKGVDEFLGIIRAKYKPL